MKVTLFDFQNDALHQLRSRLDAARPHASPESPQVVTLSAPTGSGKTVMMTALFEALLVGPDDQLEWPTAWRPRPDTAILWLSDSPELNEQTRRKIEAQSDKIFRVDQLVTIDSTFDAERLEGGRVYFVNTHKLASDKLLTREGDKRTWSIWRTFAETARTIPDRFLVVIDEAHRGMTSGRGQVEAQSIVQRFLKGHLESGMVKAPLVIGVSATPKRFNDLLADTAHTVHKVQVRAEEVRASGLLKEHVLIHRPDAPTRAEFGLLGEAARQWRDMSQTWAAYCAEEGEAQINPILVVQVEDAGGGQPTRTDLAAALRTIEEAIGRPLRDAELAHSLQEGDEVKAGERIIRRLEASRIQDDPDVGVVFFKMALSTGWDCPRAEVMMSFRRAADHTYIAQLLGRMVRTPLARRVERRAELNDVHLYLPHFDGPAVNAVVVALRNSDTAPPTEAVDARDFAVLARRPGTEPLFEAMGGLVTYRVGAHRTQRNLRRHQAIARQLTVDAVDENAWEAAKAAAIIWMGEQIERLKAAQVFEPARRALTEVSLRTHAVDHVAGVAMERGEYLVDAAAVDIDRLFDEADRVLGNGLGLAYRKAHAKRDAAEVKIELAVLSANQGSLDALEQQSGMAFNALWDLHRAAIGALPETRRLPYDRLRAAAVTPERLDWRLPETIEFPRAPEAPIRDRHLYVDDNGGFHTDLGTWEAEVLQEELLRDEVVGWLRNLPKKAWSLELPYQSAGRVVPMFPDLLIVRRQEADYRFDVLEPHDPSRADNAAKAIGLARFAEKHGHLFGRIQLIRKRGPAYRRLELNSANMQERVGQITNNDQLDALFEQFAIVGA